MLNAPCYHYHWQLSYTSTLSSSDYLGRPSGHGPLWPEKISYGQKKSAMATGKNGLPPFWGNISGQTRETDRHRRLEEVDNFRCRRSARAWNGEGSQSTEVCGAWQVVLPSDRPSQTLSAGKYREPTDGRLVVSTGRTRIYAGCWSKLLVELAHGHRWPRTLCKIGVNSFQRVNFMFYKIIAINLQLIWITSHQRVLHRNLFVSNLFRHDWSKGNLI